MDKVLAIIVTYNGMQWIDRCLGSVRSAGIDAFVVDNGSTDGTAQHIQSHFPEVKLTVSKENLGFGAANNLGFKAVLVPGARAVHDRAGRRPSKEARMNLKCVSTVVRLSNPGNCLILRKTAEPLPRTHAKAGRVQAAAGIPVRKLFITGSQRTP